MLSQIFARFPLFAVNLVSFPLAVIGVALATGGLHLFIRPAELRFLGNPQEDDVARLEIGMENQPLELEMVHKKTALFLRQFNVADDVIKKIRLACEELLTNIDLHAYKSEGERDINLSLALCGERLAITVSDDGRPFNPFSQEAPDVEGSLMERDVGGLGIFLVRSIMDKVAYRRQTGKNVTTLLICFGDWENSRTRDDLS